MIKEIEDIYKEYNYDVTLTAYAVELMLKEVERAKDLCKYAEDSNKMQSRIDILRQELYGLTYFDNDHNI